MSPELAALCCWTGVLVAGGSLAVVAWRRRPGGRPGRPGLAAAALTVVVAVHAHDVRTDELDWHHAMYTDEPGYLEAARHVLSEGVARSCEGSAEGVRCTPYEKATGWPVLLAAVFAFGGDPTRAAIGANVALGVLASLLSAWCAAGLLAWRRGLGGSPADVPWAWLAPPGAAFLVAAQPLHAEWSTGAETHLAASTALLLALGAVLRATGEERPRDLAALAVSAFALGGAAAARPDSLLAGPALALLFGLRPPERAGRARATRLALGVVAFGATAALGYTAAAPAHALNRDMYGDTLLSLSHVSPHLEQLLRAPLGGVGFLALGGSALVGAVTWARGAPRRALLPVLVWLLAPIGLLVGVLAFARFQERMAISALVALAPLGGFGFGLVGHGATRLAARVPRLAGHADHAYLPALAAFALAVGWTWLHRAEWEVAEHYASTQAMETLLATELDDLVLPEGSVLLAEHPVIVNATRDEPAMPLRSLDEVPEGSRRFVVCDMFCEPGFGGGVGPAACPGVLRAWTTRPVVEVSEHGRVYGVYELLGPRTPDSPPLRCPGEGT